MPDTSLCDFSSGATERHLVDDALLAEKWPLAYSVSYSGKGALRCIGYFENGLRHYSKEYPIRCFISTWTAAVVISFVPLEAVRDPHIREWFSTFSEVPLEDAKKRLTTYPDWPYDGRTILQAQNDLNRSGVTMEQTMTRTQKMLKAYGLEVTKKF